MKKFILLFTTTFLLITIPIPGCLASNTIIEINDIYPEQSVSKGFALEQDSEIFIEAKIGMVKDSDQLLSACWILNSDTRNLVWECSEKTGKRHHKGKEVTCEQTLTLSRGAYEVYYALNPSPDVNIKGIGDILDKIFSSGKKDYSSQWGVKITSEKKYFVLEKTTLSETQTIVQISASHDENLIEKGFSISEPLKVRIYAIGEGSRKDREMYDFGWIMDANSRKRIWEMTYRNSSYAGGTSKNKKVDEIVTLPAGDYVVSFVTDDSHSPQQWNQMPPYDPNFWGITIWGVGSEMDHIVIKEYHPEKIEPIIEMNCVRNNKFEMEGFTLKNGTNLHIFAVGEYSRSSEEFVDYGWIIDAKSREPFWRMEYQDTEHAGGGTKNRSYDGVVYFPAGSYLVYYITDDSHAYNQWNAAKPFFPQAWGITIYPAETNFSPELVENYDESNDRDILAQIFRVRNKEHLLANFTLNRPEKIRVYAIGEGDKKSMYDYAWIEDEHGNIVWKMEFVKTQHAGGAKKNRVFNNVISLNQGVYVAHFQTDGSHSYRLWNSTPPDDQVHWGLTIIKQ